MTSSNRSFEVKEILSLPETVSAGGAEYYPEIKSVASQSNALWVMGRQALLKSQDGVNWENRAANFRREGSFYVSSVIQGAEDLRIFARTGSGLKCYRWDEWDSDWKALFSIPISSPGLFAAWTDAGLVLAGEQNSFTEILCRKSDKEDQPRWRSALSGSAIHLQIASSGVGLCALWRTNEAPSSSDSNHSAVYFTNDSGRNWRMVATMGAMLLTGASIDEDTALVGGTGGVLGIVDKFGLQESWKEDGGDIVAVDAASSQQFAIIESDHEPAVQNLLFRERSGGWTRFRVAFGDRVQCIKLVASGECVVCTRHRIYRCRLR